MTVEDGKRQTVDGGPGAAASSGPLTVRALTEIPYLGTRLHAGAGGAGRLVTWAHSSEIDHPWEWLEPGDLLMTLGLALPAPPQDQADWVQKLSDAGVSGVAFAEGLAPPLSDALIDAAERCAFPILYTTWTVPFGQISRAVATANYGAQLGQLVKVARIYDLLRSATAARSQPQDLLRSLAAETRSGLFVCINETGRSAFGQTGAPPRHVHRALLDALEQHDGRLPGFLRVNAGDDTVIIVPVPTDRGASLLAVPKADTPPFAILQHIATVAALELERMSLRREELHRLGTETLAQLLEGSLIQGTAAALEQLGLAERPIMMVALSHDHPEVLRDLHNVLADHGLPSLLRLYRGTLYGMLPGEETTIELLEEILPAGVRVGVSAVFHDPTRTPAAAQQAQWALGSSTAQQPISRHGDRSSLFGPRSPAEAQMMVDHVLGAVIDYDSDGDTELLRSLRVFLECNRSWKLAAERLFIHKQTLIYRMHRVEELTGRNLSETTDVVDLWLALQAHEVVGGD